MKVGIMGCGVIGNALLRACTAKGIETAVYDPNKEGMKDREVIKSTSLVFLCLPTPTISGAQQLVVLEDTLAWLDSIAYQNPVVIRSTMLPGTTASLAREYDALKLVHCPEFLTAASPFEDLIKQAVVLVGSVHKEALEVVFRFWKKFDKKTPIKLFTDPNQTEMAKYIHNCFLATKVSFFNDIFELCRALNIDYNQALYGALEVKQILPGHTAVPGPDGEQGYGGMCFPKDMNALQGLFSQSGVAGETVRGAITGNIRRRRKPEDR